MVSLAVELFWESYGNEKSTIFLKKIYVETKNTGVLGDFNFGQVVRVFIHQDPSYFFKKNKNFELKKFSLSQDVAEFYHLKIEN